MQCICDLKRMRVRHDPVVLILKRQVVPALDDTKYGSAAGVEKSGYVLADTREGKPEVPSCRAPRGRVD
jgi:transketolase